MKKTVRILIPSLSLLAILASACRESEGEPEPQNAAPVVERAEILPLTDTPKTDETVVIAETQMVWYCKSSGAKRYHLKENCGGLKRCKHTIEKQSQKEAEALGLTLCKNEY